MGLHNCNAEAVGSSCWHLIAVRCPISVTFPPSLLLYAYAAHVHHVHSVDSRKLAGAIRLPQGRGGCSKIRKKNTYTHRLSELKCLDREYTGRRGTVAKHQTFTQNVECLSPSSSPLAKDVSITCIPVWWFEVVCLSLMFCLEPDWAWPDCTALKQLEG